MFNIRIHGDAKNFLGKEYFFDCSTIEEGLRALEVMTNGKASKVFQEAIKDKTPYCFIINGEILTLSNHEIVKGPAKDVTLDICPFSVELGGVEAFVSFFITYVLPALIGAVISLALSAMFAPSLTDSKGDDAKKDSYLFNGSAQTLKQGGVVPLGYGLVMVPGKTISAKYIYSTVGGADGGGSCTAVSPRRNWFSMIRGIELLSDPKANLMESWPNASIYFNDSTRANLYTIANMTGFSYSSSSFFVRVSFENGTRIKFDARNDKFMEYTFPDGEVRYSRPYASFNLTRKKLAIGGWRSRSLNMRNEAIHFEESFFCFKGRRARHLAGDFGFPVPDNEWMFETGGSGSSGGGGGETIEMTGVQ